MSTITVTFENDPRGYWTCSCGNVAESDGFVPVNEYGDEVEPIAGAWDYLYRCCRCWQMYRDTPDGVMPVARDITYDHDPMRGEGGTPIPN